jgi:hypothetical protein
MGGMEQTQRDLLERHGYDPDLLPRGVGGGPERVRVSYAKEPGGSGGWSGWPYLRNRVCYLDGVEIDGHEASDLDPLGSCIHCGVELFPHLDD